MSKRGGRWKRWTEADVATLRAMYAAHRPMSEIATTLGRTEATTRLRVHYLGLHRPSSITRRLMHAAPELQALFDPDKPNEFTEAAIAYRAAIAAAERSLAERMHAARRAKIAELEATHRVEDMPRNLAIVFSRLLGRTLQDIGDRYGITRERVRQIVERSLVDSVADDEAVAPDVRAAA